MVLCERIPLRIRLQLLGGDDELVDLLRHAVHAPVCRVQEDEASSCIDVDLYAAVGREGLAQQLVVLHQHLAVALAKASSRRVELSMSVKTKPCRLSSLDT